MASFMAYAMYLRFSQVVENKGVSIMHDIDHFR